MVGSEVKKTNTKKPAPETPTLEKPTPGKPVPPYRGTKVAPALVPTPAFGNETTCGSYECVLVI